MSVPTQRATQRVAAFAAIAVAASISLVGCSALEKVQPIGSENATGTIEFWGRAALSSWDKAVVAAFNKSHDDLKVKYVPIADENYVTKLSTALRGGNVPDLVSIDDVSSLQYISKDQFLEITDQVNDLEFKDQLSAPQLDLATLDGKIFGTPAVADLSVMLYNKALFEEAGITEPPTTYDQILDDARAVRELGDDTYGFTFAGQCGGCLTFTVLPNVYADGGNVLEGEIDGQTGNIEGNANLKTTLELYKTIWSEGLAPQSAQSDDGSLWTADFKTGNVGMVPSGMFTYASADEDFQDSIGITPLVGPDGGVSTYIGGANFAIPAKSVNQAGAWEYIKFALELDQQRLAADAGYFPIRTDLADDPAFQADFPLLVPGLSAAPTGNAPRTLFHNEIFTQASGPWLAMFNKAVFDGDVDGAMTEGQAGFDAVLKG